MAVKQCRLKLQSILSERQINQHFVLNILDQYSHLSLFSESSEKQEALFFTICGLLQIADQTNSLLHTIVQFKNTLLQNIKSTPTDWTPFIRGACWLHEELQQDSGMLISFLQQVSMISLPNKARTDTVQQAMTIWAESASNEMVQITSKELNRIHTMLKDAVDDIPTEKGPRDKS